MILRGSPIRKCANSLFFSFFQFFYRFTNVPEYHFGNITGCCAENRNDINRIEIINPAKILTSKILPWVITYTGKCHKSNAVFQHFFQPHFEVGIIQFFKKASTFDRR